MTPREAQEEINKILDACEPEIHDDSSFQVPMRPGTYGVSVTEIVGSRKGNPLILVRDVDRRLAMWIFLNIRNGLTCNNPKLHKAE